jgi:hypothetical protein
VKDPEEIRRRGKQKIALGVAMLLVVIIATFILMPTYYR